MSHVRRIGGVILLAGVLACEPTTEPVVESPAPQPELHAGGLITGIIAGGGAFLFAGEAGRLSVAGVGLANGTASGAFHHKVSFAAEGTTSEFFGRVTCLAFDAANGRAWIGGKITLNRSTEPTFQGAIHQPGQDIWFRVLDTGRGSADPDRTTFVGFKGGAGIETSEQYCAMQIWPANPPGTFTSGNLGVR
jgi:hypothetical protein